MSGFANASAIARMIGREINKLKCPTSFTSTLRARSAGSVILAFDAGSTSESRFE